MKLSSILACCSCSLLLAAAAPADAYVKATWFNSADAAHKVVSGQDAILKAVCDSPAAATFDVVGPGVNVTGSPVTNNWAIEHTIPSATASGTYTITVRNGAGASLGSDTYAVSVVSGTVTDLKEIAIENGLWYLHKSMIRYATIPNGAIGGRYEYYGNSDGSSDPSTIMAGQAFVDAGHLVTGNANNPYTENVQRLVNFTTEHLGVMSFTANPKDGGLDPEGRTSTTYAPKDGRGVFFAIHEGSPEIEYGFGPALRFLATCGYTRTSTARPAAWNDALNCGTGVSIQAYTFPRIMQEMIDFIAWAQLNTKANSYVDTGVGFCPTKSALAVAPGSKGGWPYWNEGWKVDPDDDMNARSGGDGTYGDVAVAYWTAQGLIAAQARFNNATNVFPSYLRTDLLSFISNHVNPITGEVYFGPAHNVHLMERAGQGLVLLQWTGVTSASDSRVAAILGFLRKNWAKHTYHARQGHPDANYICHDETGAEKKCYQHFLVDADPLGFWICDRGRNPCEFEVIETLDDINLFAFKTVTEGLAAYPTVTDVPAAAPADHKTLYRGLLIDNQIDDPMIANNGYWADQGWVTGYAPMGTAWAISTLTKL